jgi:hypothetical protein
MGDGTSQTDHEIDALLAKMRQLESLDEVIADSVRRTRALLEEAAGLRDRARQELAEARAEIERDRAETAQHRADLTAIARRILGGTAPTDQSTPAAPAPVAAPAQVAAQDVPIKTVASPGQNSTIIVHGVTRPAMATGLRAHLMAQSGVTSVDPREFAEGILRLQVIANVPIAETLFTGWKDGEGLTVVQGAPNVIEVILPGA